MDTLLSSSALLTRIRSLRKAEVQDLYDAALDVAKGSRQPHLAETAQLVIQQIRRIRPQWI